MCYILEYEGNKYELREYNYEAASILSYFYNTYKSIDDFFEKYKAALYYVVYALGSDAVKTIIKDINNVDVNIVFRLVESIKCEYDKPVIEERRKKIISSIGIESIEKLKNNKLCNKDD